MEPPALPAPKAQPEQTDSTVPMEPPVRPVHKALLVQQALTSLKAQPELTD